MTSSWPGGVELLLGEAVAEVTAEAVTLASRCGGAARTLVWAAGVRPTPWPTSSGCPGPPEVASRSTPPCDRRDDRRSSSSATWPPSLTAAAGPLPQLAPVAMQVGRARRRAIARLAEGAGPGPSATSTRAPWPPSAATPPWPTCRCGIRLTGFLGWLAWLSLHLVYLAGFRNRISVFLNWAWNWFTYDRGPRIILPPDR